MVSELFRLQIVVFKNEAMFELFKSRSPLEKLQEEYRKLMSDAYRLSTSDRKASDSKYVAAEAILKEIDALIPK